MIRLLIQLYIHGCYLCHFFGFIFVYERQKLWVVELCNFRLVFLTEQDYKKMLRIYRLIVIN